MRIAYTLQNIKPGLVPGLFLLAVTLATPAFPQSQQKLSAKKQQLEEDIKYTNSLLEQTQKKKQSSLHKVQILNRQIEKREALIQTMNREIGSVDLQIQAGNVIIGNLTTNLKTLKAEYASMVSYAYKTMNSYNRLVFIFSSRDFNQAWLRLRYYQQFAEYMRRQAEKIRKTQAELAGRQRDLQQVRDEKVTLVTAKEQEKNKLTHEKQDKDRSIQELSSREKELATTLKAKQKALDRLQDEIEKLIAEERHAAKGTGGKATSESVMTPAEKKLSGTFAASKGALPWPSEKGIIVSTFGEHPHPVLEHVKVRNNGIDILVANGTTIRSVFSGRVSRVLSVPNLNKVVIIRHGEYLTVYSNLDEVYVTDGQEVTTKQAIAKIHSDPDDGKSELHFEIWLGKSIQDPQAWLTD